MDITQFINYAKGLDASEPVVNWLNSTALNHFEKNGEPSVSEVEHVIDYLIQNEVKKINQMSYPQAVKKAEKWVEKLQKEAKKIQELTEDIELIHDFGDGFKIVQLVGENAYKREGKLMRNCVASYFGRDTKIYSLRDKNNNPHATLEHGQQIKGKGNGPIHPKYIEYVVKFLEITGMEVRDSEMENLGYINIEEINDKEAVFPDLFKDKYFYKENRVLDKKGNPYNNLTLWGVFGLFKFDAKLNIKWNFDVSLSIKTFISNIKTKLGSQAGGNYSQLAGGYRSQLAGGESSVVVANDGSKVKGGLGSVLVLCERDEYYPYHIKFAKTEIVDGKKIKADTWYKLENKKFVESN